MASSSGKRIKVCAKKKSVDDTSSNPADRIDYSRIFSTEEQMERFSVEFLSRPLMTQHWMDWDFMVGSGFQFPELIAEQSLQKFVCLKNPYFHTLVHAFYSNMRVNDNGYLNSELNDKKIVITPRHWESAVQLKHEGTILNITKLSQLDGFDREETLRSILKDPTVIPPSRQLRTGKLQIEYRLLHYVIVKIICARPGNFTKVLEDDIVLLWIFINKKKINWPQFLIAKMRQARGKGSAHLPYPCLISRFISKFKANTIDDGTLTVSDVHSFGSHSLNKMKIMKVNGVWQLVKASAANSEVNPTFTASASASAPTADPCERVLEAINGLRTDLFKYVDDKVVELQGYVDDKVDLMEENIREYIWDCFDHLDERLPHTHGPPPSGT